MDYDNFEEECRDLKLGKTFKDAWLLTSILFRPYPLLKGGSVVQTRDLTGRDLMVGLAYGTYGRNNGYTHFPDFYFHQVPEPTRWFLGTLGLAAVVMLRRRAGK